MGDERKWCACYRALARGSTAAVAQGTREDEEFAPKDAQLVDSVDDFIDHAGGWGPFQTKLAIKVNVFYAFIGVDNLLAAFLAPSLAEQWALSLTQQQCLSSFWYVGGLFGFLVSGVAADTYGRRPVLLYCSACKLVGDLVTFLAPSLGTLLLARVFASFGTAGAFNVCYPILAEHAPPESRARINQGFGLVWQAGVLYLVFVALLVRRMPWQALSLSLAPGAAVTLWLWAELPESPRFLQAKGRYAEANQSLLELAKANGHGGLRLRLVPQGGPEAMAKATFPGGVGLSDLMMRMWAPGQASRSLATLLIHFVSSGSYYCLCFAPVVFMRANLYVAQLLAAMVEVPAVMAMAPLADHFGRTRSMTGLFALYGFALLALALLPNGSHNWHLYALLLARTSGQAHMTLKWVITAETFPTAIRSVGLGLSGICGQLGAVIGPMLFALVPFPFLILSLLCLPAILCVQALPETSGSRLD